MDAFVGFEITEIMSGRGVLTSFDLDMIASAMEDVTDPDISMGDALTLFVLRLRDEAEARAAGGW